MVGSAASATGGPLTAAGASLGGRGAAASLAASGAAPGEAREGQLAALKRGVNRKLDSTGIGIPDSNPDSYDEDESARGRLVGGAGSGGCAVAIAATGILRKWLSTRQRAILV
jgi:hypothetical protein